MSSLSLLVSPLPLLSLFRILSLSLKRRETERERKIKKEIERERKTERKTERERRKERERN
jgi:hypothetical protein